MRMFPTLRLEPPPVYFMHIPKTAGSSLRQFLFSAYAPRQARGIDAPEMHQIDSTTVGKFRCVASHLGPGLLPFLSQADLLCITMVREPVEQHISRAYYRQARLHQHPETFQPAFLEQMRALPKADSRTLIDQRNAESNGNAQTRFLGTMWDLRPYFQDGEIGRLGQPLLQPLNFPVLSEDQDLKQIAARAHQQLEQMAVVGITERFAESTQLIGDLLGIPLPKQPPATNISQQKRKIDPYYYRATTPPDLIARIEAINGYDQELYAHASELFAAQWARYQARTHRTISLAPCWRSSVRQVRKIIGQGRRHLTALLQSAPVEEAR